LASYLALFALAIQLAVSFAHVHRDNSVAGRLPALLGVERTTVAAVTPDPARSDIPVRADDYCAVCALIHLAGSLVAPEVPPLSLAIRSGRLRLAASAEFDLAGAPLARFQARAPPIV